MRGLLLAVALLAACHRASPDDVAVREFYLARVATIAESDHQLAAAGRSAEERARAAYQIRHDARLAARAKMQNPAAVAALEARDLAKYGHPDGPTFDELLAKNRARGLSGDAAYLAIVESAQRTNGAVNEMMGVK
jgi:hypothetical protein